MQYMKGFRTTDTHKNVEWEYINVVIVEITWGMG